MKPNHSNKWKSQPKIIQTNISRSMNDITVLQANNDVSLTTLNGFLTVPSYDKQLSSSSSTKEISIIQSLTSSPIMTRRQNYESKPVEIKILSSSPSASKNETFNQIESTSDFKTNFAKSLNRKKSLSFSNFSDFYD